MTLRKRESIEEALQPTAQIQHRYVLENTMTFKEKRLQTVFKKLLQQTCYIEGKNLDRSGKKTEMAVILHLAITD